MSNYDYSLRKDEQDALPEGALTSVTKGQHVWIATYQGGVHEASRFICVTGGKVQPRLVQVKQNGERWEFAHEEKFVIKVGHRDQYGYGHEFFFSCEADCVRHIERILLMKRAHEAA